MKHVYNCSVVGILGFFIGFFLIGGIALLCSVDADLVSIALGAGYVGFACGIFCTALIMHLDGDKKFTDIDEEARRRTYSSRTQ